MSPLFLCVTFPLGHSCYYNTNSPPTLSVSRPLEVLALGRGSLTHSGECWGFSVGGVLGKSILDLPSGHCVSVSDEAASCSPLGLGTTPLFAPAEWLHLVPFQLSPQEPHAAAFLVTLSPSELFHNHILLCAQALFCILRVKVCTNLAHNSHVSMFSVYPSPHCTLHHLCRLMGQLL